MKNIDKNICNFLDFSYNQRLRINSDSVFHAKEFDKIHQIYKLNTHNILDYIAEHDKRYKNYFFAKNRFLIFIQGDFCMREITYEK